MVRAALLSNVNVESLARRLAPHPLYVPDGFGAWASELADPASPLWAFSPASVCLLLDGAELIRGRDGALEPLIAELDGALGWVEQAAERAPAVKFFIATLDIPAQVLRSLKHPTTERVLEHHWFDRLRNLAEARPNLYLLDTKRLVESVGREQFYSNKRWYLGGIKYSVPGEKLLAKELSRVLGVQATARKKCLVLDLDNTLWGGVVGEDGVAGLALADVGEGARFKDFQRRIRQLKDLGVILAVVSKNNAADVDEVFDRHPDMVLEKGDFAALKINWSPKPQNLTELAQDLDIGLDSLVFIDDNPVEREAVRAALPEVVVPEFPADTCQLAAFLEDVYRDHFFALESTEEDRQRTETYLQNAKRAAEKSTAASIEEFLAALQTKITFWTITEEDVPRAAQLTQKTNQFNLTTRRYTEQELHALRASPDAAVYMAQVADKHGDNGKVFLAIVRQSGADAAELDTFLMSCRVMGRFLEDQLFDHLVQRLRHAGVRRLRAHYLPTKKNHPARALFDRLEGGVRAEGEQGALTWEFDLTRGSPVTRLSHAELLDRG